MLSIFKKHTGGPHSHKHTWRHGGKTENIRRSGRYTCRLNRARHQIKRTNVSCYLDLCTASGFQYQALNSCRFLFFYLSINPRRTTCCQVESHGTKQSEMQLAYITAFWWPLSVKSPHVQWRVTNFNAALKQGLDQKSFQIFVLILIS